MSSYSASKPWPTGPRARLPLWLTKDGKADVEAIMRHYDAPPAYVPPPTFMDHWMRFMEKESVEAAKRREKEEQEVAAAMKQRGDARWTCAKYARILLIKEETREVSYSVRQPNGGRLFVTLVYRGPGFPGKG